MCVVYFPNDIDELQHGTDWIILIYITKSKHPTYPTSQINHQNCNSLLRIDFFFITLLVSQGVNMYEMWQHFCKNVLLSRLMKFYEYTQTII